MPAPPSGLSPLLMPGPRAEPIRLRTLIALRWVAVAGQLAAVATAWMIGARFPIGPALALIGLYAAANTMLAARGAPVTARRARHHLAMDAVQLGLLLTLTGGTSNPFAPLMLVPVTIGAAALRMSDTLPLAVLTVALVTLTALAGIPLEFVAGAAVPPRIALQLGDWLALLISAAFFVVYVGRVSTELSATSQALFATQLALSREQRLQHLGGIVAAAAHEMGTPLATIKLVGSELQDELQDLLPDRPGVAEDLRLLRASADRCRDILRAMGQEAKRDDYLDRAPFEAVLREAAEPHLRRGKDVEITLAEPGRQPDVPRRAEIVEEIVPGAHASFAEGGGPDKRSYRVDCSKIARVLPEFEPRWTVNRGVEQLHDAYARHGLTFDQFTGTRYLRINRVRELQEAGRLDDELRWRTPVGAESQAVGP